MTIFLIILLLLAIMINILISNSKNENFVATPDKLIYLYNTDRLCPNCRDFTNIWSSIENEVNANPFYYTFNTIKYNIDTDTEGRTIANDNRINTAPAILYKKGDLYKIYKEKSKDMTAILEWARKD
jgi:hypothetical protein